MKKDRRYYIKKMNFTNQLSSYTRFGSTLGTLSGTGFIIAGLASKNAELSQIGLGLLGVSGVSYQLSNEVKRMCETDVINNMFDSEVSDREKRLFNDFKTGDVYKKKRILTVLIKEFDYSIDELCYRTKLSKTEVSRLLFYSTGESLRDVAGELTSEEEAVSKLCIEDKMAYKRVLKEIEKASVLTYEAQQNLDDAVEELEYDVSMTRIKAEQMKEKIASLTKVYTSYLKSEMDLRNELNGIIEFGKQMNASEVITYNLTKKAFKRTEEIEKDGSN